MGHPKWTGPRKDGHQYRVGGIPLFFFHAAWASGSLRKAMKRALAFILMFFAPAYAQIGWGVVTDRIRAVDGRPVAGLRVAAMGDSGYKGSGRCDVVAGEHRRDR